MTPRVYVNEALAPEREFELPSQTAHYIHRVLRRGPDDQIRVFNQRDGEFAATIVRLQGASATLRVGVATDVSTESPLHTTLVQGLCRSQRMDYCVQKATELGVTRILPVVTERCVVRLTEKRALKRLEHWQAVATSACEQSGRTSLPAIEAPATLVQVLQRDDLQGPVILDPDKGLGYSSWPEAMPAVTLFVGPEGGLAPEEIGALIDSGAARWRMGPRVFRTETAGVVALTLAQTRWGDLD